MSMNEEQIKIAGLRLAIQMKEVEPLILTNMSKLFGVRQETLVEGLIAYEEATTCNQGFITESTYQMLESATKFMAILRHRENIGKIVAAAKTLISQNVTDSAEGAVGLAIGFEDNKPKVRREAIAIVQQWIQEQKGK